ncbi:MAG TPA: helix-turn-helix domain-containing protein [Acidimicrobiales bacterium]|nr:helix-turn-helix domain-containing protein [Acidimicrobiales bacterium]
MDVVAKALGVTERHVRRLVDERRIPFVKVGYFIRFEPEEVARWVKEHRVDGSGRLRSRRLAR